MVLSLNQAVVAVTPLSSGFFSDMPYSPALLLDVSGLDAALVDHPRFLDGCREAFEDCCCELDTGEVASLAAQMVQGVHEVVINGVRSQSQEYPFAWFVGFEVGWLSAIALCRPAEAATGMQVLRSLVASMLRFRLGRSVRCVGGDGWPLDL